MFLRCLPFLVAVMLCSSFVAHGQNMDFERDRHKTILTMIKDDVKKNYYDPTFHGKDIDSQYKGALEKMDKASSVGQLSGIIAQFLVDFDDSHLFYLPPGKANKTDYGYDFRMVGDKCLVIQVNAKSDAAKKGLQVGDELYSIEGFGPSRDNLWKMRYMFFRLRPMPALRVNVIKPDGKQAQYEVAAKITQGKRVMDLTGSDLNQFIRESEDAGAKATRQYYYDKLGGAFIWKMPSFSLEPPKVDEIIDHAKKFPAIIFDLRGNGGGRVDMVLRLIGDLFPADVKVADEKRRKEIKEVIAKSHGKDTYQGKIAVLIDSGSASASEVFARVMQIEKRGTVFGDQSAGAVMESRVFGRQLGLDVVIFFGTSVTVADLIMKDGKSLEKIGVTPDVKLLATGKDLSVKRDVVLSKAAQSLGVELTPEQAGTIFPDDDDNDDE